MRHVAVRALLALVVALGATGCGDDPAPDRGAGDAQVDAADAAVTDVVDDTGPGDASTSDDADTPPAAPADYTAPGPWGVGTSALSFERDGRTFQARLWYPAAPGTAPSDVDLAGLAFVSEQSERVAALLATAPETCPGQPAASAIDADVAEGGPWPLVVYSHCHECLAVSGLHLGERLASHGVVMAAVEHVGNTLFDRLDETGLPLDTDTLALREADATQVLDALLASDGLQAVPLAIDAERVAVAGHSFGAVTAGRVLQEHSAPIAGMAFAAPMENPLLPGVTIAELDDPVLFVVAVEDNSITEFGNTLLRGNADDAPAGSWRVEVADAGHWSFSDLCGLVDLFAPGCGEGMRQTAPSEAFTYLAADRGRAIAAALGAAFVGEQLLGDEGAMVRTIEALGAGIEGFGPNP